MWNEKKISDICTRSETRNKSKTEDIFLLSTLTIIPTFYAEVELNKNPNLREK